jgi:predicted nucleic acid-binding Zn ribbon protein
MNAKPKVKCEECDGACRKLLGMGSGIIFKGSGFYETDYKKKKGEPSGEQPKKSDKSESNGSGDSKAGTQEPSNDSSKAEPKKSESKTST